MVIVQPVVPHYRVPLFAALAAADNFSISVLASQSVPNTPDSVTALPSWADLKHDCIPLCGARFFWQKALRLPPEFGPGDVLVFNGNPRFLSTALIFAQAKRRGVGRLWWGHGWSATSVEWRAQIRFQMMRLATVSLLYTDAEVLALKARYPNWKRPALGLNNTLDVAPIVRAKRAWEGSRLKEFQQREGFLGAPLFIFCGRLRAKPSTDLAVALRAFAKLYATDRSLRFAIIGDGEEATALHELEHRLHIGGGVLWAGPIFEENKLAPWFLSATCAVYPGAVGLSVIQAFAYGVPVVTHSERALHGPEFSAMRQGSNGLLFKRGDPDDLAEKMKTICADRDVRTRLRNGTLRTIEEEFSFDGMVGRFAEAIRLTSAISCGKIA